MSGVIIVLRINGNQMHWPSPRAVETPDFSPLLTRNSIETQQVTCLRVPLRVPLQNQMGVSVSWVCNA